MNGLVQAHRSQMPVASFSPFNSTVFDLHRWSPGLLLVRISTTVETYFELL